MLYEQIQSLNQGGGGQVPNGPGAKQDFRRTDFGSRLLAAEGEGAEDRCG